MSLGAWLLLLGGVVAGLALMRALSR